MKPSEVLSSHNLKRTSCREGIIEVMMAAEQALSEIEIREQLAGNYDRTTFYRSFKTLEENKIVHKIVIDNQFVRYALDNSMNTTHEHAHFYCNDCHTVKCIASSAAVGVQLPEGFLETETVVLVKGKCASCKNNTANI